MSSPQHPRADHAPEPKQGWETWLPATTTGEALGWASKELTICCILLVGALRNKHKAAFRQAIAQMQLIVLRLEQFVYFKFPEWKRD